MSFIGYPDSVKGFLFICSPNNALFTSAMALFNESLFLKCSDSCNNRRAQIPVGNEPTDDPSNGGTIPSDLGDDNNPKSSIPKRRTVPNQDVDQDQLPPDVTNPAPPRRREHTS